ncbi:cytochrome P450 [Cyathus striatus]|nr:cytochrome P450 [Cyathus striatus]
MGFSVLYLALWRKMACSKAFIPASFPPTRHDHYRPLIKHFVRTLQLGLLQSPENFYEHLQHMAGGFALALGYGIRIKPFNDPYVSFFERDTWDRNPSRCSWEISCRRYPSFETCPEWMPGAGFKRQAKIWYKDAQEFRNKPFREGERELAAGTGTPSFLSMCMESYMSPRTKKTNWTSSKMLRQCFIQKARQEIDSVVDHHQAPSFEDEDNLPYLSAVLMEALRWHPPLPISVPHFLEEKMSTEDTIFQRIYGSRKLLGNGTHEADYPNPNTFNPERFLKDGKLNTSVRDPRTIVFGFGRRICPGSHIGWSTFWYTSISILSMFEIVKKKDKHGVDIEPIEEYESGLISPPLEFDCEFRLRFPKESFASVING